MQYYLNHKTAKIFQIDKNSIFQNLNEKSNLNLIR